jgi:hypothetical protein
MYMPRMVVVVAGVGVGSVKEKTPPSVYVGRHSHGHHVTLAALFKSSAFFFSTLSFLLACLLTPFTLV